MPIAPNGISIVPITGVPAVKPGDDLPRLLTVALNEIGHKPLPTDVIVVAQKVVSKAENAIVYLTDITPGVKAIELAEVVNKDPRLVEAILSVSARIVRSVPGVLITETNHGFICANAGIDTSNGLGDGIVTLLPVDPDRSAQDIRRGIYEHLGVTLAVIVSDSFNRPWRQGSVNVAIGTAGFEPLFDGRGEADDTGHLLRTTVVSVADEIASAAQLVMGETGGVPAAVVRGLQLKLSETGSSALLREPERDLFR